MNSPVSLQLEHAHGLNTSYPWFATKVVIVDRCDSCEWALSLNTRNKCNVENYNWKRQKSNVFCPRSLVHFVS